MGHTGFCIAMAADIGFASCALPSRILHRKREYLIVNRWGDDGEFISIARTDTACSSADAFPIGLQPKETWAALLLSASRRGTESWFLLLRAVPDGMSLAGRFMPAEGYVRLQGDIAALRLKAAGRHADCVDRKWAMDLDRVDLSGPSEGIAWHVEAARCPWSGGEFVADRGSVSRSRDARGSD